MDLAEKEILEDPWKPRDPRNLGILGTDLVMRKHRDSAWHSHG